MKTFTRIKSKFMLILFLLLVILAGPAWFVYWWYGPAHTDIRPVILISIDTCRADYLSCYGYSGNTTANIDAFARQSILFENVYSPVPLTLPAHCSMLTGTIPPYHGVHDNLSEKLSESNVTLAEIMREQGYKTAAIISSIVLDSKFGLNQGFEEYQGEFTPAFEGDTHAEQSGSQTTRLACNWLEKNCAQPFFLFLHYYDPHDPYQPPEPFASRFADNLYAGEIAYTDHCIGQVLDKLKSLDLYDSSLIIITGDHGEMLGEHGENTHAFFIYQSAIKVPLIIKPPGMHRGRRIGDTAALIDIVPTILSLLKIPIPPQVSGQDLAGFCSGKFSSAPARYIFTESLTPTEYKCNPLLGVVNWPWKYIYTTRAELYYLQDDPKESLNLAGRENQRARNLQNHLKLMLDENLRPDQPDNNLELDQATLERLRGLGYVGSGVEATFELDENKPDPKDTISLHLRYAVMVGAIAAREYEEARKLCAQLLTERADIPFFHCMAGDIAVKADRIEEAIDHYRYFLQLKPDNHMARNNLAAALSRQGRLDQAVAQWQEILRQQPNYAKVHENLAGVFFKQGDYKSAITHWMEAHRIEPDNVEILNNLAWIWATSDDPQLRNPPWAVQLARRAGELTDFQQPGYLDTLAAAYAAAGQFPQAVETAQKAIKLAWAAGQNDLSQKIQKRLLLYQSHQPYRERIRSSDPSLP